MQLSELSFGSWVSFGTQFGVNEARELLAIAYDHGVNFFDNAEVYSEGKSEEIMGEAIQNLGWRRDSFCLSSKVFWGGEKPTQSGLSRKHIHDACNAALKRLRVDYLDLYFCHRPDLQTPVEETVRAMSDLVRQGKILYWGTSEWTAQAITEAFGVARQFNLEPPTMEQPEYNLFHREKIEAEFLPLYDRYKLGTTIWSPLASGILTGKYSRGIPSGSRMSLPGYEWLRKKMESPEGQIKIEKTEKLQNVAKRLETTLPEMAIAWCLKNPNVSTVILGASKKEQLVQNLKALDVVPRLNEEVLAEIEAIVANRPATPVDWK